MVERIPRYRPLGVRIGNIPGVNFTRAAEARSRVFSEMSQTINRITDFVVSQEQERLKIEGAEYGAEQAPTPEQIDQAYKLGMDVEDIVPGDTRTVFGRAARKTALASVASQLQTQASTEITALRAKAELELTPLDDLATAMNAVIDGYAAPLADISAIEAQNFRAATSSFANSAYLAHAGIMTKEVDKRIEAAAIFAADTAINNVDTIVAGGPTYSPEGIVTTTIENKLDLNRTQILQNAVGLGPSRLKTYLEKVQAAEDAAIGGVVSKYVMDNNALGDFLTGEIDDPAISSLYVGADERRKSAILNQVMSDISEMNTFEANVESAKERRNKTQSKNLQANIVDARMVGDFDKVDSLLDELKIVDEPAYVSLKTAYETEGGIDNGEAIAQLNNLLFNKRLSRQDVNDVASQGKITFTTLANFYTKIDAQNDERHRMAMTIVKAEEGIAEGMLVFGDETRKAQQVVADIETQLILARQENAELDPIAFVNKLLEDRRAAKQEKLLATGKRNKKTLIGQLKLPPDATTQQVIDALTNSKNSTLINIYMSSLEALLESEQ